MLKNTLILVLLCQVFLLGEGCEKNSFVNVHVKASKYFTLADDPDDVKLAENFTGCLDSQIAELKDVLQIVITRQKVNSLENGAVEGLPLLHSLKFQHNEIELIKPGAFLDLPGLSLVDLSHNNIQEIREGVFNGLSIKRLLLNNNKISTIDSKAFDNLPNLVRIDLERNNINEWNPDWFSNSPKMYYLSVAHNHLKELPAKSFKNFKGKHEISERGGINFIVTSLHINNNELSKIDPKAFEGLKQLDFLDLASNQIENIEEGTFAGFENIEHLFLNRNKIRCLSQKVLSEFPTSQLIDLNENPVDCECVNVIRQWSNTHTANLKITARKYECIQERIRNTLDSVKNIH